MFITTIQPRLSETNAAGHIGFTTLPVWFEFALDGVYRLFTPDLDVAKWRLIIVKCEMECLVEINHRQMVTIVTDIHSIGNSSFKTTQTLEQNGTTAARAQLTLVHFDYHKKQACPLGQQLRHRLKVHQRKDKA
jgi:acyl-CoA thioester hydrolase